MTLLRLLYKSVHCWYDWVWNGNGMSQSDTVVIIGGSDNFGCNLCLQLVNSRIRVVNIDTVDNVNLDVATIEAAKQYYCFLKCDSFLEIQHIKNAISKMSEMKIYPNIFINNINVEFESVLQESITPQESFMDNRYLNDFHQVILLNLENVMLCTKFFLNNSEIFNHHKPVQSNLFYLINISIKPQTYSWKCSRYLTSKKALNQYHDSLVSEFQEKQWTNNIRLKTVLFYLPYQNLTPMEYNQLCPQLSAKAVRHLQNGETGPITLY